MNLVRNEFRAEGTRSPSHTTGPLSISFGVDDFALPADTNYGTS